MQIIINVTNIKIIKWTVDVEGQRVITDFQMLKDDGTPYERREAIFWVTMPPEPHEPYWYLLPAEYVETLTNLTIDARTALMALIN
jgi:hypothetical protein